MKIDDQHFNQLLRNRFQRLLNCVHQSLALPAEIILKDGTKADAVFKGFSQDKNMFVFYNYCPRDSETAESEKFIKASDVISVLIQGIKPHTENEADDFSWIEAPASTKQSQIQNPIQEEHPLLDSPRDSLEADIEKLNPPPKQSVPQVSGARSYQIAAQASATNKTAINSNFPFQQSSNPNIAHFPVQNYQENIRHKSSNDNKPYHVQHPKSLIQTLTQQSPTEFTSTGYHQSQTHGWNEHGPVTNSSHSQRMYAPLYTKATARAPGIQTHQKRQSSRDQKRADIEEPEMELDPYTSDFKRQVDQKKLEKRLQKGDEKGAKNKHANSPNQVKLQLAKTESLEADFETDNFKIDSEISKQKGAGLIKTFQRYKIGEEVQHRMLEDDPIDQFDQFAVNKQKFNIGSHFDENEYSTYLNALAEPEDRRLRAERIEAEILGSTTAVTSRHMKEERGQLELRDNDNEEALYSAVVRSNKGKNVQKDEEWRFVDTESYGYKSKEASAVKSNANVPNTQQNLTENSQTAKNKQKFEYYEEQNGETQVYGAKNKGRQFRQRNNSDSVNAKQNQFANSGGKRISINERDQPRKEIQEQSGEKHDYSGRKEPVSLATLLPPTDKQQNGDNGETKKPNERKTSEKDANLSPFESALPIPTNTTKTNTNDLKEYGKGQSGSDKGSLELKKLKIGDTSETTFRSRIEQHYKINSKKSSDGAESVSESSNGLMSASRQLSVQNSEFSNLQGNLNLEESLRDSRQFDQNRNRQHSRYVR